ncbi:hypothetical protein SAMN05216266_11345 [Amycolatopsis marina]|uniref:Uncharacterized protein n=1 Tax=Amycolatopsis marina TaxID=490629 RepID=A0A1I1BBD9_9PSEU|nr:hypothetical protein [Amycolatopsis marina]SFB47684.1 hypothetical protein SAMN05216266_11345 [Amycolatopsis marina]
MIERDRELLARLRRVNSNLGTVVVEIMAQQDGGELPPDPLRLLGRNFAELGDELLARAAERDAVVLEGEVLDPPAIH